MKTIIVAMSREGVIGRAGQLPWHYHDDMVHFKKLTMGKRVLMGARTYESLPKTGLPGRVMLVASHEKTYPNVQMIRDLEYFLTHDDQELWVIGGASVYRATLPKVDALEVTWVETDQQGDVYFPDVDWSAFRLVSEERKGELTFARYERKK